MIPRTLSDPGNPSKKERKELGKQERQRRLQQMARSRRNRRIRNVGVTVLVVALVVLLIVYEVHKSNTNNKAQRQQQAQMDQLAGAAGCNPLHSESGFARDHVSEGTIIKYTTTPPIGGSHYFTDASGKQIAPAPTGVHPDPIQNEIQVHNLEHGHIGIQYNGLSKTLIKQLEAVTKSDPDWIFMAPYPSMSSIRVRLAFTAWGKLISCQTPNAKVVDIARTFIAAFKNHGPESIAGTPL